MSAIAINVGFWLDTKVISKDIKGLFVVKVQYTVVINVGIGLGMIAIEKAWETCSLQDKDYNRSREEKMVPRNPKTSNAKNIIINCQRPLFRVFSFC